MPNSFLRLLAAALLLALAACSHDPASGRSLIKFQAFEDADTDHDGKLSREECAAVPALEPLARYFDRIDTDRSGYLSWMEVRAARFPVYREPRLPAQ